MPVEVTCTDCSFREKQSGNNGKRKRVVYPLHRSHPWAFTLMKRINGSRGGLGWISKAWLYAKCRLAHWGSNTRLRASDARWLDICIQAISASPSCAKRLTTRPARVSPHDKIPRIRDSDQARALGDDEQVFASESMHKLTSSRS